MKYSVEIAAIDPDGVENLAGGTEKSPGDSWDSLRLGVLIGDVLCRAGTPSPAAALAEALKYVIESDRATALGEASASLEASLEAMGEAAEAFLKEHEAARVRALNEHGIDAGDDED